MIKFFQVILLLLPIILNAVPDRDVRGNYTENFLHLQGKADIKLGDHYYAYGDDINLEFTITNYGNEPVRFYPTLGEVQTFQFIVTDENDTAIPLRDGLHLKDKKNIVEGAPEDYIVFHEEKYHVIPSRSRYKKLDKIQERRNRSTNLVGDQVKEIIIHKGESFTKKINLSDLYDLKPGKKYYITGYFYPNYVEDKTSLLKTSNQAYLTVYNTKIQRNQNKFQDNESISAGISPEEIIYLFLGAEMKENWKNYFKYIHFPEFIMSYTKFANLYSSTEESNQEAIIDDFKKYLTELRHGKLKYYKVIGVEEVNSKTTKVTVSVEREQNRIRYKYEYFYTLKKLDDQKSQFWKITNLVVKVKR